MTETTTRTPDQVNTDQAAADAFFARRRSLRQLEHLQGERYAPNLLLAMREAKTATTWKRDYEAPRAARRRAFSGAVHSPLLDAVSRNLLRQTRGIRRQSAAQLEKNDAAANRFFARVDGLDLSAELTAHPGWKRRAREAAARLVYLRLMSAPLEPVTEDESRMIMTKTFRAQLAAVRRAVEGGRALIPEVRPVGMRAERALQIAMDVLDQRE